MSNTINDDVRAYWEEEPCNTNAAITKSSQPFTREWYENIEDYRYRHEPFIHSVAQFTRWHGAKMLEIGVGAGTDHLQWARAGAHCYGIDLTEAAIETTRKRLELYGFHSVLQRHDAERLSYEDGSFELVYSWGVIHHSDNPVSIVNEIHRVLKPGGTFIGMLYGRHSVSAIRKWVKYALLRGKPWHSISNVLWNYQESVGSKAYSRREIHEMFSAFSTVLTQKHITESDRRRLPEFITSYFPNSWGWYISVRADK
jgi:ubiquinone/menaquinone biosynthesis C-methylase UbiE